MIFQTKQFICIIDDGVDEDNEFCFAIKVCHAEAW